MSERMIFEPCDLVRQTAYEARAYLGAAHFEKIYENALTNRLRKKGPLVQQQFTISVYDEDGTPLNDFNADLLIENVLIVERKAAVR